MPINTVNPLGAPLDPDITLAPAGNVTLPDARYVAWGRPFGTNGTGSTGQQRIELRLPGGGDVHIVASGDYVTWPDMVFEDANHMDNTAVEIRHDGLTQHLEINTYLPSIKFNGCYGSMFKLSVSPGEIIDAQTVVPSSVLDVYNVTTPFTVGTMTGFQPIDGCSINLQYSTGCTAVGDANVQIAPLTLILTGCTGVESFALNNYSEQYVTDFDDCVNITDLRLNNVTWSNFPTTTLTNLVSVTLTRMEAGFETPATLNDLEYFGVSNHGTGYSGLTQSRLDSLLQAVYNNGKQCVVSCSPSGVTWPSRGPRVVTGSIPNACGTYYCTNDATSQNSPIWETGYWRIDLDSLTTFAIWETGGAQRKLMKLENDSPLDSIGTYYGVSGGAEAIKADGAIAFIDQPSVGDTVTFNIGEVIYVFEADGYGDNINFSVGGDTTATAANFAQAFNDANVYGAGTNWDATTNGSNVQFMPVEAGDDGNYAQLSTSNPLAVAIDQIEGGHDQDVMTVAYPAERADGLHYASLLVSNGGSYSGPTIVI